MKNIVIGVVVVALIVGGYMLFGSKKDSVMPETNTSVETTDTESTKPEVVEVQKTDMSTLSLIKKAAVSVSESEANSKVTLVDGKASFAVEGSSTKGTAVAGDVATAKTFNGRNDVIGTVAVNPDGKGTYQWLVLFENKANVLTEKSIAFLGQGVEVKSITTTDLKAGSVEDYIVIVKAMVPKKATATQFIFTVEKGEINPAKSLTI